MSGYFAIGRSSVQAPVAARANVACCKDAGHRGLPVIVGMDPAGSVQCHLLAQKSNFVGVDLWLRDDIQFPRLLSEIVATQDKLDIPCLAESMDLTIDEVGELFDRAQGAWATHLQESLETQKETGKSSFNAWCRQADGRGTTWLSAVRASSLDEAVSEARLACASDWGWQGREDEILVVGIQPGGQMSEVVWDDDGLHESTVDEDGMAEGDQP